MKKILLIIVPLLLFCNLAFSIETDIYECQNDYKLSYKKSNPPKIKFGKNLNDKSEFIAETHGPLTNWVWARGNENGGEIFYNTFNKNINRLYFEMAELSKGDFKKILDTPKEGVEITFICLAHLGNLIGMLSGNDFSVLPLPRGKTRDQNHATKKSWLTVEEYQDWLLSGGRCPGYPEGSRERIP